MKQPKHYTSIDDLPQYNWRMIGEKNDLSFMLIDKHKKFDKAKMKIAFDKIKDEYIDTFGINDNYLKILELKRDIAILEIDMAISKDRTIKNFIRISKIELDNLLKSSDNSKQSQTTFALTKHLKCYISEKDLSVRQYAELVEGMKNDLTSNKAA